MSSATVEGDLRLVRAHRDCLGPSQRSLVYGRLCEALPFFPCGADVLAPICPLTVIREVDLNEYVVRGASEGEQKAVLVESNGAVLFARPWGALVNRSEELFQLVKIVTAALLVLEALYRQLGYGMLLQVCKQKLDDIRIPTIA